MRLLGFLFLIVSALLIPGFILRIKSIAAGRKGPGIWQPYRDIANLFAKGQVFSNTTGLIFQIAPAINLSCIIAAAMLLPFGRYGSLISFDGDFVYFLYILALGRFFSIISALDTGSSFEGMGASREALFSMLAEPAFFILFAALAIVTGHTSFSGIFSEYTISGDHNILIMTLIGVFVLFQSSLVETCRVPVDDPKTHLELTMIHEVMILDNSGFDKALIHIATYLKQAMYGLLIYNLITPFKLNLVFQIIIFVLVQALYAITAGLIESFRARNKMNRNPKFILTISAVAWIALVIILILKK